MATYYISPYGSNSNNGLGPDPTAATNKPFASIDKCIGSSGVASAGDFIYMAPGVYRQAGFQYGVTGSSGSVISIIGDPGNSKGFKDSSGVLLTGGEVRLTNATTSDTATPGGGALMNTNGKSYFSFSNIWILAQTTTGGNALLFGSSSHDFTFTNVMFQTIAYNNSGQNLISLTNSTTQLALNITFDRCIFVGMGTTVVVCFLNKTSGADYNTNVTFQTCLFMGGAYHIRVASTGTGSFFGGGLAVKNCQFWFSGAQTISTADANLSTTYPLTVNNSVILNSSSNAFSANTSGQIVEDYNIYSGATNVTAGSNSKASGTHSILVDVGQAAYWGQYPKQFGTPTIGSPLLGFGNASGGPTTDFVGRAKPEGGNSLNGGLGHIERHNSGVQETSVVDSGSSVRIDGPGSQDFDFCVDSGVAITITVKCQYDTNHGTTTPPQLQIPDAAELGITSITPATASATTGSWLTLSIGPITPTASGVLRAIGVARPSAANGKCYFDTFAVS